MILAGTNRRARFRATVAPRTIPPTHIPQPAMTPAQFIAKWAGQTGTERALYQQHFLDLCELLDHPKPADIDKDGSDFCFEKGAGKTGGGNGWADVFKRGHFAIEYKGPGRDLGKALQQVQRYALALDNPPLLVVCDIQTIQIHTNFTNTVSDVHTIAIDELATPANLAKLKALFFNPEQLKPGRTVTAITEDAARHFAELADTLRTAGHEPHAVAHFLNQCLFACFAEDVGLLPDRLFTRLLESAGKRPDTFVPRLTSLFAAMKQGGPFGEHDILWFNGGLFAEINVFPLPSTGIDAMLAAARLDWSQIDPTIFGTLFERGLDPAKRSQLGAHYTDAGSIRRILGPVVEQPLLAEWDAIKPHIASRIALWQKGGTGSKKAKPEAEALYHGFLERLRTFRVLDPACGSGNFLYLALKTLKDLQHKVMLEAEQLGLHYDFASLLGPECVAGIELNPYAAELARVVVWIGEIQWMLEHGFTVPANPVLKNLDPIECRDALITLSPNPSPTGRGEYVAADWPVADAIVGNPPFLGGSKKSGELGRDYCNTLNRLYEPHVPGGADLVCYWFHKARQHIASGYGLRCGLVATQAIRNGSNRKVLDAIVAGLRIFNAWSDEPWVNEGAAVRVSLICFGNNETVGRVSGEPRNPPPADAADTQLLLNGLPVARINADLTAGGADGADLTTALPQKENIGVCFMGASKKGPLDIDGALAREWLTRNGNPNGKPNSDVLRPLWNALDLTRRPRDMWVIDFGTDMPEEAAALYECPFEYAAIHVKPEREKNNDKNVRKNWWRIARSRPELREALNGSPRFAATPAVAKHRTFTWVSTSILPDQQVLAFARPDDTTFGILHSRFHELWSLRLGTSLEDRPRYTPTTCFETFPFPAGLTPADTRSALPPQDGLTLPQVAAEHQPAALAIAQAAQRLNALRENWLNPPEWVERVPEVVPGYPDRLLPKPGFEAELKKRTLTNLYNARPAWLAKAHEALDAAVAAAYGWHDYSPAMSDEAILQRLLALNLQRSGNAE